MIETTARRDRRTSTRLDQLIRQSATGQHPWREAAEPQPWQPGLPPSSSAHPATARSPDADSIAGEEPPSVDAPPRAPTHPGRPADDPPTAVGTVNASSSPDRPPVGLENGWPVARPWWRRALNRLVERCLPERTADPPRWRLVVLAAGAVFVGIAVAIGFALSGAPDQPEVPPALPAASVSEVRHPASATTSPDSSIVISVVGRVATPGLVTLPDGSRVADALEAAGGPVPGARLGSLNLARRLNDGEQIYVAVPTPPGAEAPAAAPADGEPGTAPVDLNSASLAALDTLPGVGPVTAQRIVDWRTRNGRFASVDQLREIEGIGPIRFGRLKDLVVAR